AAFADAVARSPRNWDVRGEWASALVRRGERRAARRLVASALPLNPMDPRLLALAAELGVPAARRP
ncbi:MAG TPA: tetratricopeptide repeat protein, partial [Miltoncostaea sp.]|nr:tetratricopeptide repeat protein [Miltoncostaea sp.]